MDVVAASLYWVAEEEPKLSCHNSDMYNITGVRDYSNFVEV